MIEQEIDQPGNSVSGVLGSDSGKMAILLILSYILNFSLSIKAAVITDASWFRISFLKLLSFYISLRDKGTKCQLQATRKKPY